MIQTLDAEVDQSKLTVGTTLYNGDTITTASDGSMLASLRSSQLAMDPSSQAALELCTDELHVLVYYGTVNFTATVAVPKPNAQTLGGVVTFADTWFVPVVYE